MTSQLLNTAGLVLDIVGVCILFVYGFPQPDFGGGGYLQWGGDKGAPLKRKLYARISVVGLICLVGGFGLQVVATWMK